MTSSDWYQFKQFVEHASGISMDAWHILIGSTLFLVAALVLRRSVASPLPWLAVLLLEIGNEIYDLRVELWPDIASQVGEGVKDIMLTMSLPSMILLAARYRPQLFSSQSHDDA